MSTALDTGFPHGTYAGYGRHRRKGDTPCEACTAAQRAWQRDYDRKRNRKKATAEPAPKPTAPITYVELLNVERSLYARVSGWQFTCLDCGKQTAPYKARSNAEAMQAEHAHVCPAAIDRPKPPKPNGATPNRGRLPIVHASGARTAYSSMPRK